MWPLIFAIGTIMVLLSNLVEKKNNKLTLILIFLFLFVISSLKSYEYTGDLQAYVNQYMYLDEKSYKTLIVGIFTRKVKDPTFYLFAKICFDLGFSSYLWLSIIAAIFALSCTYFIYKQSDNYGMSFLLLLSLGYFSFSMTGLRQTVALSLILVGYSFLKQKKYIHFIVFVVLASLFHISAICVLIALPCKFIKIKDKFVFLLLLIILFGIAYAGYPFLYQIVDKILGEKYSNYLNSGTHLNLSGFMIQGCILIFTWYFIPDKKLKENNNSFIILILSLGLFFQFLASILFAEMFRISMYFSIFAIVSVPMILENYVLEPKEKRLLSFLVPMVFVLYLVFFNNDYILSFKSWL